jgi:uncharacterized protein (DUF1684 family)
MNDILEARRQKDAFFARHSQSPLTAAQKRDFKGLDYFPYAAALRLELAVERYPEAQGIQMQTSTGDVQEYQRYGKIRFTVEGQPAELTIFANQHGLFLPFVDSLAGQETYPAGRYLEPERLADGKLLIDFNQAYNPYCAYNDRWSCPLTPFENRLKVAIRAGEKLFPHAGAQG